MWRYGAGAMAALALVAAAVIALSGRSRPAALLPAAPAVQAGTTDDQSPLPDTMPEATPKSREQKRFGRYDKDRDGKITRDEYLVARRKAFAKLDKDGDGRWRRPR